MVSLGKGVQSEYTAVDSIVASYDRPHRRIVWTSAIKPISGNFLKLDGVGQVIPTKAYSKKV
jgi:hypothetical protein